MLNALVFRLIFQLREFCKREDAQDLVEYALVVAVIAFGAVGAMRALSTEIKTAFSTISNNLATSL
jgi:Flp pilus assembly pilin Flp